MGKQGKIGKTGGFATLSKLFSRRTILNNATAFAACATLLLGGPFVTADTVEVNGTGVNNVADLFGTNAPVTISDNTPSPPFRLIDAAAKLHAGVVFTNETGYYAVDANTFGSQGGTGGYRLFGDLDLSGAANHSGVVAAVIATNTAESNVDLVGNITISGQASDALYGFLYTTIDGGYPNATGKHVTGKDVTVINSGVGGAFGVRFMNVYIPSGVASPSGNHYDYNPLIGDGDRAIKTEEEISFATIAVTAKSGAVVGFEAGETRADSTVTIDRIFATAENITGASDVYAAGMTIDNIHGKVSVNDISVETNNDDSGAFGLFSGRVFGEVEIDSINVTRVNPVAGGWGLAGAVGVEIDDSLTGSGGIAPGGVVKLGSVIVRADGDLDAEGVRIATIDGKFNVRDVDVVVAGDGNALGLDIMGVGTGAEVEIGRVHAETEGGNAVGLKVTKDQGVIVLMGDITAITQSNFAVGVDAGGTAFGTDVNFKLGNNINVTAECGQVLGTGFMFADDSNATIDLNGFTLTTCSVNISTLVPNRSSLTIIGNGLAHLGVVTTGDGSFTVGDGTNATTVSLNIGQSELGGLGDNTISTGSTLVVYGVANPANVDTTGRVTNAGTFNFADPNKPTLLNRDIFTNYEFRDLASGGWGMFAEKRDAVMMSDGYLMAMMMHDRYTAWRAVRDHLISGSGYNHSDYRCQAQCDPCVPAACDACDPCDPCTSFRSHRRTERSAWVNYIGRSDQYQNGSIVHDDWHLNSEGVQFGVNLFQSKRSQFGFLAGYEKERSTSANWVGKTDRVGAEDFYFGIYGTRVLRGGADVRGVFAYGKQDYDMFRWGSDDLSTYTSSFKGYTTEANLELGKRITAGRKSMRPVIAVDLFTSHLKAAEETANVWQFNDNEAMSYDKTNLTQVFLRTGTELRYRVRNTTLHGGVYYAYDVNGQERKTGITDLSNIQSGKLVGSKLGRSLLAFNLGSAYMFDNRVLLFASYQGEYVTDRANSRVHSIGQVGTGFKF